MYGSIIKHCINYKNCMMFCIPKYLSEVELMNPPKMYFIKYIEMGR